MRTELRAMLGIAGPVILGEIGWMTMGLVDSAMVGPLGPAALGATGMGGILFLAIAVFGMGLMLGLDTLVSRATGAGDRADGIAWLGHGLWLAIAASPILVLAALGVFATIDRWGLHPDVLALARPYMRTLLVGLPPLLIYSACRRYLQGVQIVGPIVWILFSANILNVFGNWVLVYGHLGVPPMGVVGSAWATNFARIYLAVAMWIVVLRVHRGWGVDTPPVRLTIVRTRLRELLRLGVPAALQVTFEVGVFSIISTMAGMLTPTALGAHQITLNVISVAFMVPLGFSSAAAVRVGHAAGARDPQRMAHAGWLSFAAVTAVMLPLAVVFATLGSPLVRVFTQDPAVIAIGVQLLWLVAPFQVFDGAQATATGVLRGLGDTRTPVYAHGVAQWLIGLPLAYALCFVWGWGIEGLWLGLYAGVTVIGIFLTGVWMRRARALSASLALGD